MGTIMSKSRTFAVITEQGAGFTVHFLCRKAEVGGFNPILEVRTQRLVPALTPYLAELIELLYNSGLTVRFFDKEERQWMDRSSTYGLVRAPGPRDGTWGEPDLEAFEEDYLKIV